MRKTRLLLLPLLLASCASEGASTSDISTVDESSSELSPEPSSSSGTEEIPSPSSSNEEISSSSSPEEGEVLFEKSFEGYEEDSLPFFLDGYSTANSKFGANYLNLIDPEGYVRTCEIPELEGEVKVELYCHVTNLNNLSSAAIGETFAFTVSAIAYSIDDDGFSVSTPVDSFGYSHAVTEEEVASKSLPGIPPYTSDFSADPYVGYLSADGANRLLVTMNDKIEFSGQGCNLAINRIKVIQVLA